MDISDVVDFANNLSIAQGSEPEAVTDAEIYGEGLSEAADHYVFAEPTHTDYLWFDPVGRAGISNVIKTDCGVDCDVLGTVQGTNVIGTTKPLTPELDPAPRFPWNLIPYNRTTAARLILLLWMQCPGNPYLCSRKPFGKDLWVARHTGAFQFRFQKVSRDGEIIGRANLNLMDGQNRNTVLRLLKEMQHGRFLHHHEAEVFLEDAFGSSSWIYEEPTLEG